MKKQLLSLFAAAAALVAGAQTDKTDLAENNLKGRVKSVNEIEYEAVEKFGEVEKGKKTSRIYREYNAAGYETLFIHERFEDGETDKFVRTTRYENNKLIEMKEEDNGQVAVSRFKYNAQGAVESMDELDGKGRLKSRQKTKYNTDGLAVEVNVYKGDGSEYLRVVSTYNAKKEKVKEETYTKEGGLITAYTFAYDSRGNQAEYTYIDYGRNQKKPTAYKYVFDDKDRKVEERHSIAGLDKKEVFEYDAQGNLIGSVDQYGAEEKKVYTYDAQNNWTKCITTKKTPYLGTEYVIQERQVKYY